VVWGLCGVAGVEFRGEWWCRRVEFPVEWMRRVGGFGPVGEAGGRGWAMGGREGGYGKGWPAEWVEAEGSVKKS